MKKCNEKSIEECMDESVQSLKYMVITVCMFLLFVGMHGNSTETPVQAEVKQETVIINLASCKGCHGVNWERSALGKSKIVKDLTKEEIQTAILGYKEGSYGGIMKGVMKGQLAQFKTIEEIQTLIDEIDIQIHPEEK